MNSPEHGLTLSNSATDYLKWLDGDGMMKPFLNPSSSTPTTFEPGHWYWFSIPHDVRGKPDITIQVSADTLPAENVFSVIIQTSLDGNHWTTVPEFLMTIAPPVPLTIQNITNLLLLLFLKTNYIRVLIQTSNSSPWPNGQIVAAIVTGEA